METQRLDGKAVAEFRRTALSHRSLEFQGSAGRPPALAVVLVGEDPASRVYVRNKIAACRMAGIESLSHHLPATIQQGELEALIQRLGRDNRVDGILVQLPLPHGLDENRIIEGIPPEKDPDGLTSSNLGLLFAGRGRVAPCTPAGVLRLLNHYQISLEGKRAVVVGRSRSVGRPMAQLLLEANATVTNCHSRTVDLASELRRGEIVVVAAGLPRFVGRESFAKGAVVVDVGIHRGADGKLCGDTRQEELEGWVSALSPVPGGVGPMTIQLLLENTVTLAELRVGVRGKNTDTPRGPY